jgi:hypothetical protein
MPCTELKYQALLRTNAAKRKYPREHGLHSRLYRIWRCIEMRCYQRSHEAFDRYGGRGIGVCDEWRYNFMCFRDWALSHGYDEDLTIDRKDNDLGYSPSNCRWVTMTEQQANRRDNLRVRAFGEVKILKEWSRDPRCQIGYVGLHQRIKAGMHPELAITRPSRTHAKVGKP